MMRMMLIRRLDFQTTLQTNNIINRCYIPQFRVNANAAIKKILSKVIDSFNSYPKIITQATDKRQHAHFIKTLNSMS